MKANKLLGLSIILIGCMLHIYSVEYLKSCILLSWAIALILCMIGIKTIND